MSDEPITSDLDPIRQRISAVGLRSTSARIAVMRILSAATSPLSHADVAEKLAEAGFDRVTVYRNLVELAEAGLATRIDLGDHTWRFELRRESDGVAHQNDHPHFVCIDCGQVSCLPGVNVSVKSTNEAKANVGQITEVLLKGHCGNCS